jgi:hypothetical protein
LPKPWENKSGAKDPTAYAVLKVAEDEEQRVSDFVKSVKTMARLCGFEIDGWITVRVKKSGRVY